MSNSSNTSAPLPNPEIDISQASSNPYIAFCFAFQLICLIIEFIFLIYFTREYYLTIEDGLSPALKFGKMVVIQLLFISWLSVVLEMILMYATIDIAYWAVFNLLTFLQSYAMTVFNLQVNALFSILLPKYMRLVKKKNLFKFRLIFFIVGVVLCGGFLTRHWAYSDDDPNMTLMILVCQYLTKYAFQIIRELIRRNSNY